MEMLHRDEASLVQMRNFELGIVFALPADGFEKAANDIVCWRRPARPYGDAVPWVSFRLPVAG